MRLLVDEPFEIERPSDELIAVLKSCTVFFKEREDNSDILVIREQKIDLFAEDMEEILDIFQGFGIFKIMLHRMSHERYRLVLK